MDHKRVHDPSSEELVNEVLDRRHQHLVSRDAQHVFLRLPQLVDQHAVHVTPVKPRRHRAAIRPSYGGGARGTFDRHGAERIGRRVARVAGISRMDSPHQCAMVRSSTTARRLPPRVPTRLRSVTVDPSSRVAMVGRSCWAPTFRETAPPTFDGHAGRRLRWNRRTATIDHLRLEPARLTQVASAGRRRDRPTGSPPLSTLTCGSQRSGPTI